MALPKALRPLRTGAYRTLAIAMAASLTGQGMWSVAMVFEVIALGGSELELSGVASATAVGIVAVALVGGVLADHLPKRWILRGVEAANVVAVGTAAVLGFAGRLEIWHLGIVGAALGAAIGCFYPAYSAMLPRILPASELLAANGLEGVLRPALQLAAGPAIAGAVIAAVAPHAAIAAIVACHLVAFAVLWRLDRSVDAPHVDVDDANGLPDEAAAIEAEAREPVLRNLWTGLVEGVAYTARTSWLRWTLLWATAIVFLFEGPVEVLTPFVIHDRMGLGAEAFGLFLAVLGAGSAAGSLLMASLEIPRRYLTWMLGLWGLSCLPLALYGVADSLWLLCALGFVVGAGGGAGQVIWGTLLQRRVPQAMLGRVSSLDFFVSLALMPLSMAATGPIARLVPREEIFAVVGIACVVISVIVWLVARFWRDEVAHPLPEADEAVVNEDS